MFGPLSPPVFRVIRSPSRNCGPANNTKSGRVSFSLGRFLPAYAFFALLTLSDMQRQEGIGGVEAPGLPSAIKLENVLDCQSEKYWRQQAFSGCLERFYKHSLNLNAGPIRCPFGALGLGALNITAPTHARQAFSIRGKRFKKEAEVEDPASSGPVNTSKEPTKEETLNRRADHLILLQFRFAGPEV